MEEIVGNIEQVRKVGERQRENTNEKIWTNIMKKQHNQEWKKELLENSTAQEKKLGWHSRGCI